MSSDQQPPSPHNSPSIEEQRRQNFLSNFKREDNEYSDFRMETRFTVDPNWMRLSIQNARAPLSGRDVQIKGFRPGKAPSALVEGKLQERAIATAIQWVLNDLSEILLEDPDLVILSPLEEKRSGAWRGPNEPFVTSFSFKAWRYPTLRIEDVIAGVTSTSAEIADAELETRVFEFLSRSVIPQNLEQAILREIDSQALVPGGSDEAAQSIRRAIADNLLARILQVETTEEDIEHALGLLAIERSKSLIEIQEEMEPQIEIFRQHVESQMTYAALRERLVERGIVLMPA